VKGTFIHFDIPLHVPTALQRSATCPPRIYTSCCVAGVASWEAAMQELCQAMVPRRQHDAVPTAVAPVPEAQPCAGPPLWQKTVTGSPQEHHAAEAECATPDLEAPDADGISEASTKESSGAGTPHTPGTPNTPEGQSAVQEWTSISSRKRSGQARTEKRASAVVPRPQNHYAAGGNDASQRIGGKGKGLSHFERIEVGIEDDKEFRVVQRLIGPRGKHMQDIVMQCKGAKVWIIGRGSRSWEDSVGPLVVCVGATSRPAFDDATSLVRDLLDRVHEDHRKFRR